MGDGTAVAEQWLAERRAIRARITEARDHLTTAVENTLWDLGKVGTTAAREILTEISDELDDIEQLTGEADDG